MVMMMMMMMITTTTADGFVAGLVRTSLRTGRHDCCCCGRRGREDAGTTGCGTESSFDEPKGEADIGRRRLWPQRTSLPVVEEGIVIAQESFAASRSTESASVGSIRGAKVLAVDGSGSLLVCRAATRAARDSSVGSSSSMSSSRCNREKAHR